MRKRTLWMMSMPLAAVLILASCSQPPEDTIQTVTDSFQKLEAMKAEDYAPEAFQQAEDAYADAMAEIEAQKEKSILTRSYSKTKDLLKKAGEAVDQASAKTEERRDEMQQDAATLLQDAKVAFKTAEDRLAELKTHSSKTAEIRDTFEESGEILKEAEQAFDSGNFLQAHSKADDAKAMSEEVLSEIGRIHGS